MADRCIVGDGDDAGRGDAAIGDVSEVDAIADALADEARNDIGIDAPLADAGPLSFVIMDEGSTGTNVDWFGGEHEVEIDSVPGTGVVESRVFDAGRDVRWARFEWTPSGAYGRPFRQLAEPPYDAGNVNAMGLSLLMPFDAPIGSVDGLSYPDLGPVGRIGNVVGTGATSIEGVFDQAFAATEESWVSVAMSDNLFPATAEHTLAFWARSRQSCLGRNRVFVGSDGNGSDRSHIWIGCWDAGSGCVEGSIGGVWRPEVSSGLRLCSPQDANDGEWHHIAVRKRGSNDQPGSVEIWFDGVVISSTDTNYAGAEFRFSADEDLWFGHFVNGVYPTVVDLDEALFFSRALEDAEIEELHLRGRLNVKFEIRVCATSDCSDGVYTSLEGGSGGSGDLPRFDTLPIAYDTDFTGRYAQVRLTMTSTDTSATPEIRGMRLVGE